MKLLSILWILTGLIGADAVAMGAYGAHGLAGADPAAVDLYDTANRYHMIHIAPLAIAATLLTIGGAPRVSAVAWVLLAGGIVLFSGSLYLAALSGTGTPLAPVGGMSFMAGWLVLGVAGARVAKRHGALS